MLFAHQPACRDSGADYEHHGFVNFSSDPLTCLLPIATLEKKG